eukprot:6188653-Pleurochrysis_carterae.AAC.2
MCLLSCPAAENVIAAGLDPFTAQPERSRASSKSCAEDNAITFLSKARSTHTINVKYSKLVSSTFLVVFMSHCPNSLGDEFWPLIHGLARVLCCRRHFRASGTIWNDFKGQAKLLWGVTGGIIELI